MLTRYTVAALAALAIAAACNNDDGPTGPLGDAVRLDEPGLRRLYGAPVNLGQGRVRSYITFDESKADAPVEIGLAMDEAALEGLPAAAGGHGEGHADMHEYVIQLPAWNPTTFKFVELDWNPAGHEPAPIYDKPHFDFHFYTITKAERDAIVPTDAQFQQKAERLPTADFFPARYLSPPPVSAVPKMGVHWIDMATPELPPTMAPFTATYIFGSWDGKVIFQEPMITRAYILSKKTAATAAERDELIPVGRTAKVQEKGYYPQAYRITYDATAKEYRVALTKLEYRQ